MSPETPPPPPKDERSWLEQVPRFNQHLWEELVFLRNRPLKKSKYEKQLNLDRPVAVFSKDERLKIGMGTEITLIFRSSACFWAQSASGGCTMCGYWNDRAPPTIQADNYWNQFQFAIAKYASLLADSTAKIVFKMFTSGSFCDEKEMPAEIQRRILERLVTYPSIKEIVIESRPEYVQPRIMEEYRTILGDVYFEVGIGLESGSDFVRTNIINKGFSWAAFTKAVDLLHSYGFGVKAYILFKPPFLPEYAAMLDTYQSIRQCVALGVDTISINPTNIQSHTLCSELEYMGSFRPPWLYSLLWLLKHGISQQELQKTRVICDPSAAGKDRGVHNAHPSDPSNDFCLDLLQKFVYSQDLAVLPDHFPFESWDEYIIGLLLGAQ